MSKHPMRCSVVVLMGITGLLGLGSDESGECETGRRWLAGDHHIHSRFSPTYDKETDPPTPQVGDGVIHPIPLNALMAKHHGLDWMVSTDHGGPNHSRLNLERAYPKVLLAREVVTEVIQFYGLEFNTPGADHSSLIIPHTDDEAERLYAIESQFDTGEPWPRDANWDTEARMLEALRVMDQFPVKPLVIANHPSRSATGLGVYGDDEPAELRGWNDTAPEVAVGMAGAPGHQAYTLNRDGSLNQNPRSAYRRAPTMGGFDQLTARLGGFWDSMLGEGRHWWITANSDHHSNWRDGGADFWPGEYSKTYVWAEKNHDDILDGIRNGRIFVALGGLVTELQLTASGGEATANIGGSLQVITGTDVEVTIRFLDPAELNAGERDPSVERVDLIMGQVTGPVTDRSTDTNPTTRVIKRFTDADWRIEGAWRVMTFQLTNLETDSYIRVRGTNGQELEPEPDHAGEDPWSDLWFYSNPVFIEAD